MMRIRFSPQLSAEVLALARYGDVLVINGAGFDFSGLGEGDRLPAGAISTNFILEDVVRRDGEVIVAVRLPVAIDAPHEAWFASDLVDPPEGPIPLPGSGQPAGPADAWQSGEIDVDQLVTAAAVAKADRHAAFPPLAPYQFQAVLDLSGLRAVADAAIAALPSEVERIVARSRLMHSASYDRFDPLFTELCAVAGLPAEQVDPLWHFGSTL